MNLKEIQQIIESPCGDELKKDLILQSIAKDQQIFSDLLKIINYSNDQKMRALDQLNTNFARLLVFIEENRLEQDGIREFIKKEAQDLYTNEDHKPYVKDIFNYLENESKRHY